MPLDPALRPFVERPEQAAVLLDFDGSLSRIVDDPAAAAVLPEARAALAALVGRLGLVAVVSGRPVAVLADALALDGVELVGQYGLERRVGGRIVVDERVAPYVDSVAAAADEAERELPDLLVERKAGVAVTVHWRTAPDRENQVAAFLDELARRHGLVTYATRMARELRPPVPVDKGTAVESLLAPGFFAAGFAGDDRGDLPAFDALERAASAGRVTHAVRIAVASNESPPKLLERSDLVVDGPPALAALLEALTAELD
ncbi:MAG: trehalose-phosphatase [Actinomycetota bacterium]